MADFDLSASLGITDRMSAKLAQASAQVEQYGTTWGATRAGVSRAAKGIGVSMLTMTKTGRTAIRKLGPHMVWLQGVFGGVANFIGHNVKMIGRALRRLATAGFERLKRAARNMWMALKITVPIIGGIAVRSALKYADALRQVTSLMASGGATAQEMNARIQEMDSSIKRMSLDLAKTPTDLAKGLYDVYSATFEGAEAMHILEVGAKGAIATLTDAEVTTGFLTKALQAFRKETETNAQVAARAEPYMDAIMRTIERGMFKMPALAESLPEAFSMAKTFNIPFEEILAFTSAVSRHGVGLDESATGLRSFLVGVANMGPDAVKAAKDLFGEDWDKVWGPEALARGGLAGAIDALSTALPNLTSDVLDAAIAIQDEGGNAMDFLAKKTGVAVTTLTALIPNIRAAKPMFALAGAGAKDYAADLDAITDSAGATERTMKEMMESEGFQMERLRSIGRLLMLDLGRLAFPAIAQAGEFATGWFSDLAFRSALDSGAIDTWEMQGVDPDKMSEMWEARWDEASPFERLKFTITTAWTDMTAALTEWFNTGGREDIERVSIAIGETLNKLFEYDQWGIGGAAANIGAQIGQSIGGGIAEGISNELEASDFFSPLGIMAMFKAQVPQLIMNIAGPILGFLGVRSVAGRLLKGMGKEMPKGMIRRGAGRVAGWMGSATGAVSRTAGRAGWQGLKGLGGFGGLLGKGLFTKALNILGPAYALKDIWDIQRRNQSALLVSGTGVRAREGRFGWAGQDMDPTTHGILSAAGMIPGGGSLRGGKLALGGLLGKAGKAGRTGLEIGEHALWQTRNVASKQARAVTHAVMDAAEKGAYEGATAARTAGQVVGRAAKVAGRGMYGAAQDDLLLGTLIGTVKFFRQAQSDVRYLNRGIKELQNAGFVRAKEVATGKITFVKPLEGGAAMTMDRGLNSVKILNPAGEVVAEAARKGRQWSIIKDIPKSEAPIIWDDLAELGIGGSRALGAGGRHTSGFGFAGGGFGAAGLGAAAIYGSSRGVFGPTHVSGSTAPWATPGASGGVGTGGVDQSVNHIINGGQTITFNIYESDNPDATAEAVQSSLFSLWDNG